MTRIVLGRVLLLSTALLAAESAFGFVANPRVVSHVSSSPSLLSPLHAKKKKGKKGAKGFGKTAEPAVAVEPTTISSDDSTSTPLEGSSPFLQSVEQGGSSSIPTVEVASSEPELPPEERAKKLLREQYGLRSLEEQRMADSINDQRQRMDELKKMAEKEDDIDIMAMLPAPLLKGIDTFLKLGVAICTTLFVTAGMGITAEAWSKTSGSPLPDNIDAFIVDVVEPNFTTGLLVLLGFSVSLGGFAALQLTSASSQYKEE
ncbi:expressed unknown protein [Seminavis robusta]|uniref:Uncharacterized protein n=1 Tax=Seminavis robusta TaxID=568900 RepID=A0A9N8HSE8_9STRA|nr:expressed unknown protein [Seminavis robusta]|eukprot:Sro1160_g247720.1 n/a (260) ;mRNA; f:13775-14554